ncbi:diadenylate cyclase [Bradyrhizobium sp. GCM10028915]|uniref:diadenylate cyclase n=1 Tax=Bradyrhizobium sp. GCM10028915 TaxID=3273385 RepID=UPI0036088224
MKPIIDQFMWPYQDSFREGVQHLARSVFADIGFEDGAAVVFLVGLAAPGHHGRHAVCIEPEDGPWKQETFATLPADVERAIPTDPMQRMHYDDQTAMREKPENIRRNVITKEIARRLEVEGERTGMRSFCSRATKYGDFYIVAVLQVPERGLTVLPTIRYRWQDQAGETNLVLECISQILDQAAQELSRPHPEPGRAIGDRHRLASKEIADRAAGLLMRTPFIAGDYANWGLYESIEEVSKLMYEGSVGTGRIILAADSDPSLRYVLKLSSPVLLNQTRWLRKLLQMSTRETALICGYAKAFGLGSVSDVSAPLFSIDFTGRHQWDLRRGDLVFLRVKDGQPRLPQDPIQVERFEENMRRIFPRIADSSIALARNVMDLLFRMGRGSTIVFAADAAEEAARLESQGTRIQPAAINKEFLERASSIDGAIIADPHGVCHAVGVILDGNATPTCTPARGGRYNSAVRYVGDGSTGRLALVLSEDGTLDVVPLLRPQIDGDDLERAVEALGSASIDNYHPTLNLLDENRFYLNADQCRRVNEALDRIGSTPVEGNRLVWLPTRFKPDPEMNDGYLKKKRDGGR